MHILVAGGAGYIGSVAVATLIDAGHRVTVLDNLSHGHLAAIHPEARFVKGDIMNRRAVMEACRDIDVAMHFAAFIEVGESVENPSKYYINNISKSIRFFDNLRACGVARLVFSSTAAVYGEPDRTPIDEDAPLAPVNPYGWSKRMIEQILSDYDRAYGFRWTALRYFNAGGAYGGFGEDHRPESHLIPRILMAAEKGETARVFGGDYPTRDGSCVRDYIHVRDLAEAHVLAARRLMDGGGSDVFNLGTGNGYTVLEVIDTAGKVIGRPISRMVSERRPGDSPSLVASSEKARHILGWNPGLTLHDIISSAHDWRRAHPSGYGDTHA